MELRANIRGYLQKTEKHFLHLMFGFAFLVLGMVLVVFLLSGPDTNDKKNGIFIGNSNVASISAYHEINGNRIPIDGVKYNISVIPTSGSDDLLVTVTTSQKQAPDTVYKLKWPGSIREHFFNYTALNATLNTSTELLGIEVVRNTTDESELNVHSRKDDYHKYDDYFMFYWENGREWINFSESRIRLSMIPVGENSSLEFNIGVTEELSLIDEAPLASRVIPNVSMGSIERVYDKGKEIIVIIGDRQRKRLADFLLILSGLFFGIATGFFSSWIVIRVEQIKT